MAATPGAIIVDPLAGQRGRSVIVGDSEGARSKWPGCGRRAAEKQKEFASFHAINA
jgi:hypothetical protein